MTFREAIFWSQVGVQPSRDACWLWKGYTSGSNHYGKFKWNGRSQQAHRVSWEMFNGEIPNGLLVLHHCDTPTCVNPYHLWLGTTRDNVDDKLKKGRHPMGEKHANHVLTNEKVLAIREYAKTHKRCFSQLARQYGVNRTTISRVVYGIQWPHLNQADKPEVQ